MSFEEIRKTLESYEPAGTVYVGEQGRIDHVIKNVTHATACRVDFLAYKAGIVAVETFSTLRGALNYLGVK